MKGVTADKISFEKNWIQRLDPSKVTDESKDKILSDLYSFSWVSRMQQPTQEAQEVSSSDSSEEQQHVVQHQPTVVIQHQPTVVQPTVVQPQNIVKETERSIANAVAPQPVATAGRLKLKLKPVVVPPPVPDLMDLDEDENDENDDEENEENDEDENDGFLLVADDVDDVDVNTGTHVVEDDVDVDDADVDSNDGDGDDSDKVLDSVAESSADEEKVVTKKTRKRTLRVSHQLCICKTGKSENRCSRPSQAAKSNKDLTIEEVRALISADSPNLKCKTHQKCNNVYQSGIDEIMETSVPTTAKASKSKKNDSAPKRASTTKASKTSKKQSTATNATNADQDVVTSGKPPFPVTSDQLRAMIAEIITNVNVCTDAPEVDFPQIDYTTLYFSPDTGLGVCYPSNSIKKKDLCILYMPPGGNTFQNFIASEYTDVDHYLSAFIDAAHVRLNA
jgi:hypothetical protein